MSFHLDGLGRRRLLRPLPLVLLFVTLSNQTLVGQATDPKADFLDALGQFSLALDGTYGDEARRLSATLDAMSDALSRWDTTIQTYERAMAAEIGGADPSLAARMHLALGGVYLDRGRVDDAMTQLAAARQSDPTRVDVLSLQGLVHELRGNHAAATEAFRTAVALDPQNPVRAYVLARHLMSIGEEQAALEFLPRVQRTQSSSRAPQGPTVGTPFVRLGLVQETADVEPFLPPVLYADGFASLQRGDLARAVTQLRDAVSRDPLSTGGPATDQDPAARAAAAFRDGLVETARTQLEATVAQSPGRAEAHRILGLVNIADGEYDRGINALRTALRLNPGDERARLGLGDALMRSEQLEAADQTLRETLAVIPGSGRAHYMLGRTYQRQGKAVDAVLEFQAALALKPLLGANTIHQMIGVLQQDQQDLEAAVMAFAARVNATPNAPEAHRELGHVYFLQGEHLKARAEFEVALLLAPSDVDSHTALGQVHLREGRYGDAADAARRVLELNAAHREARYVYATALLRLGNSDDGTREMQEFQRLQAEDAEVRARAFELGRLRREAAVATAEGHHANAVALLQQALALEPTASASHLDLGLALFRARQFAEAVERLNTAAALNAHFDVHRHLAEAYAALGRNEDSQKERDAYARMKQDALRKTGTVR